MARATTKHIVQVSYDFHLLDPTRYPEALRRQEHYLLNLRRRDSGVEMTIIVVSDRTCPEVTTLSGLRLISIKYYPGFSSWRVFRLLGEINSRLRISLITSQNLSWEGFSAAIFARLADIPVLGQLHTDPSATPGFRAKFFCSVWVRMLRAFSRIRVVSPALKDWLSAAYPAERIHIAPVPSFVGAIKPNEEPAVGPIGEGYVLFVGRFTRSKRLDLWLEIAAQVLRNHPSARFVMVGEGADIGVINTTTAVNDSLRKSLTVLPWCGAETLAHIYKNASVQLVTSEFEAFGRVINEGFSMGLPCVAPSLPTLSDRVIDGETGFTFPLSDLALAVRRVGAILEDSELRARLSVGARAKARSFEAGSLAKTWTDLLWQMAEAKSKSQWYLQPRSPTFKRWYHLSFSRLTLLRAMQYEVVPDLELRGTTVDLGGGKSSSYLSLLRTAASIDGVNISPAMQPTFVADLNRELPIADHSYDNIISLNTFEHLLEDETALREGFRLLKPGGSFHFMVPFLYQVHASPSDFNRRTPFWWHARLAELGVTDFTVQPLVWDRLSSAFSIIGGGRIATALRPIILLRGLLAAYLRRAIGLPPQSPNDSNVPLGFYITGTKPGL